MEMDNQILDDDAFGLLKKAYENVIFFEKFFF